MGYDYLNHRVGLLSGLPDEIEVLLKEYFAYSNAFTSLQFSPFVITIVWMSSNAMSAMINAFNVVNDLPFSQKRSIFKKRFVAVLALFILILILVLFIFISTLLNNTFVVIAFRFAVLTGALSVLYYVLPNVKKTLIQIIPGALLASFLFMLTSYTFGYFMKNFTRYSVIYGSLSSIILLLILLFLLAYIILLGEEINVLLGDVRKREE